VVDGSSDKETTMTTTQFTGAGTDALVATAPGELHGPDWPGRTAWEIGALPLSRLRRVTEYIETHLDQALPLAQLGAVVYMSPFHFARLFQRRTGLPPHRFVVRARIERATRLLVASEMSIARISETVGFRTPSHFSTVFRRVMGITPRAYRSECLRARAATSEGGRDARQ
jgi:AraC-like DNA-binding protein